jgi:hypothetical protein
VEEIKPWLRQGDVFEEMPLVTVRFAAERLDFVPGIGAAVLLTEGCVLDKGRTSRSGAYRPTRLQFAPLYPAAKAAALGDDRLRRLRARELKPPEFIYVDDVGDGQECFALLGEAFPVLSAFFDIELRDYTNDPESDPDDPFHACPKVNDTRTCSMSADDRLLLQRKMAFYWLHAEID